MITGILNLAERSVCEVGQVYSRQSQGDIFPQEWCKIMTTRASFVFQMAETLLQPSLSERPPYPLRHAKCCAADERETEARNVETMHPPCPPGQQIDCRLHG